MGKKSILLFASILTAVLLLAACGGETDSAVAENNVNNEEPA
ncbi:hypothetical protein [Evansella sp. LMS18]|jgi:hypothetical protein|nr:hypothetical protein [Evansella sp. LMS18]